MHKPIDLVIAEPIKKEKSHNLHSLQELEMSQALRWAPLEPAEACLDHTDFLPQKAWKGTREHVQRYKVQTPCEEHLTIRHCLTRTESSKSILLLQECSKEKPHLMECVFRFLLPLNKNGKSCGKHT